MKLYNTLLQSKKVEELQPLDGKTVRIYSCGPTVYDHAHIGNLSAYVFADTLRRAIKLAGFETKDDQGGTNIVQFQNLKENVGLRDQEFMKTLPKGTEIIK